MQAYAELGGLAPLLRRLGLQQEELESYLRLQASILRFVDLRFRPFTPDPEPAEIEAYYREHLEPALRASGAAGPARRGSVRQDRSHHQGGEGQRRARPVDPGRATALAYRAFRGGRELRGGGDKVKPRIRLLTATVGILLLGAAGSLFVYLRSERFQQWARVQLAERLARETGMECRIDAFRFDLLRGTFSVRGFGLGPPSPADAPLRVSIDEVRGRIRLKSVLQFRVDPGGTDGDPAKRVAEGKRRGRPVGPGRVFAHLQAVAGPGGRSGRGVGGLGRAEPPRHSAGAAPQGRRLPGPIRCGRGGLPHARRLPRRPAALGGARHTPTTSMPALPFRRRGSQVDAIEVAHRETRLRGTGWLRDWQFACRPVPP